MSPQLSCIDTCQKYTRYSIGIYYFNDSEKVDKDKIKTKNKRFEIVKKETCLAQNLAYTHEILVQMLFKVG